MGSHRFWIIGHTALCAFSFLFCQMTLWAQDADSAAAQHFAAGHQAQDAGNLDLAAQEYLAVIHLRPDVAEAYASLGLVYNAQGKFAESARALGKAEKLKPALPGVSLYLGIDYEKQRQATFGGTTTGRGRPSGTSPTRRHILGLQEPCGMMAECRQRSSSCARPSALSFRSGSAAGPGRGLSQAADLGIERVLSRSSGTPLCIRSTATSIRTSTLGRTQPAHYYRALRQDPHWQGAHFGSGEIAFHREKLDVAAPEYHRELEGNPASAAPLARLAE